MSTPILVGLCLTPSAPCFLALAAMWLRFRYENWRWKRDQERAERRLCALAARCPELAALALAEQLDEIRALPEFQRLSSWTVDE